MDDKAMIVNQETGELVEAKRAILTQSTPPDAIKQRRGRGGKVLSYVSHDWVTRQLNNAFQWQWSYEVVSERIINNAEGNPTEMIVRGRLTIHTPAGDWVKEQYGGSDVKRSKGQIISLADDFKAASSDALKKCASLLGLALDLYGDQETPQKSPQSSPRSKQEPPKQSPKVNSVNGKHTGDYQKFWAYVEEHKISRDYALQIVAQEGNDFDVALDVLNDTKQTAE